MGNQKRRPIRKRILNIVLTIAVLSLFATSIFGVISMIAIQRESSVALTDQAKSNLASLIHEKTTLADLQLKDYSDTTAEFACFIEEMIARPERYKPRDLTSPDTYTTGDLMYSFALADESYDWDKLRPQAELFANIAECFYPAADQNRLVIKAVFFGFDNGLLLSYDSQSEHFPPELMYYNYLDTDWYKLGKSTEGVKFTEPYTDSFGRGLTMTCVCPLHDKNGAVVGVLGVDISVTDLYMYIIDLDFGDNVNAVIVNESGKVVSTGISGGGPAPSNFRPEDTKRMSEYTYGIVARDDNYYAYDTIESVGWKLFVRVPQSSVLMLADSIRTKIVSSIIIFAVFFLIILITVVILVAEISGNITKPIIDLMRDADKIIGGDLEHRAEIYMNDEIGDLAGKFNEMSDSLKKQMKTLAEVTAEKERIGTELNVAAHIQAEMLPKDFPDRSDVTLFASMAPAREMGGDFYDFFMIDDDHIGLVMADVSGKGVPAAMFMIITKTIIKIRTMHMDDPANILRDVNNTLCADNPGSLFVTAWLGILTLSTGRLVFSNAGHEYPALRRLDGDYELIKSEHQPPLAAVENIEYYDETAIMGMGDELFLYTDGVPEAKSPDGSRFGMPRLMEILNRDKKLPPEKLLADLKEEIDLFSGNDLFDDVTMMCVIRGRPYHDL